MHPRVFDSILQSVFEEMALKALALVAALTILRLIDWLVGRFPSPHDD